MYDRYTFRFISFCILLVILIFTEQYLWKLVFIFFLKENSKSLFFLLWNFFLCYVSCILKKLMLINARSRKSLRFPRERCSTIDTFEYFSFLDGYTLWSFCFFFIIASFFFPWTTSGEERALHRTTKKYKQKIL